MTILSSQILNEIVERVERYLGRLSVEWNKLVPSLLLQGPHGRWERAKLVSNAEPTVVTSVGHGLSAKHEQVSHTVSRFTCKF